MTEEAEMAAIDDKRLAYISSGRCPRCHYRGFVIGPQGGAAINIECGNVECRNRYNVTFRSGNAIFAHELPNGATSQPWPSEPRGIVPVDEEQAPYVVDDKDGA